MAIDKQINPYPEAPGGSISVDLPSDPEEINEGFQIEELEGGGVDVTFGDPVDSLTELEVSHGDNLAEVLDESYLTGLASKLIGLVAKDEMSRKDWSDVYTKGLDELGLKNEPRTSPWKGACGITHPLLAEAVVRFQSQQIGEMFPAAGPTRTKIVGKETPERIKQATRIQDYMNYMITDQMAEYREEVDKLLFTLPLAGSAFKKTYWDDTLGRPVSDYIPAEDFIVASGTKSLITASRYTHRTQENPNDIRKLQKSGFYRHCDLVSAEPEVSDVGKKKDELAGITPDYSDDEMITIYEVHAELDLEGFEDHEEGVVTQIALPYVVTIDISRRHVLSIRRNWLENDPNRAKRMHFTHFQYIPGMGFYGLGLIHLIGGTAHAATSITRQLVDAGTLANLPGGYKSRGMRISGDNTPVAAGEWRDVDVPAGKISDNLFPLPYGEPSQVLAGLLGVIVEEGRRFASLTDISISSMNSEAPVGTTLALLERNLKVMTAISARIHNSTRNELKILAAIIADHYTDYPYDLEDQQASLAADFDGRVDILPVSDPNSSTMAQRIMTYQAALTLAQQAPGVYEVKPLHRRMLRALEIQDVEEIIPDEEDMVSTDPVTENMNILNGEPVKAFQMQDHDAHLTVHMMAMQDPKLISMMEGNPMAPQMQAAGMAHVTEHLAFQYRADLEAQLGVPLPPHGEPLPPEIEAQLSMLLAQASTKLYQSNTAEQAAQEAQQNMEDPVIQDQLANTQIRAMDAETRKQAQSDRTQIELAKLMQGDELKRDQMEQDLQIAGERIRAEMIGTMLIAASKTEQIESDENQKLLEFIMNQINLESDGVREHLRSQIDSKDDEMGALVGLLNKMGSNKGGSGDIFGGGM